MAAVEQGPTDRAIDPGQWLVEHRWEMDRGEASWLETLADFDRHQGWAADGQLSGAEWLMWRTGMARATAYEKLRIAHELARRPTIREAFADGRLSYSAVRAIARIDGPDPEVDAALVEVARAGSVADVERAVRFYQLHADQERPPRDAWQHRGLRIRPGVDGTSTLEVTLTDLEIQEVKTVLQAFIDLRAEDESARADSSPEPVDESAPADSPTGFVAPSDEPSWPARRADALMEMTRVALAHANDGNAMGADRYLVHVVKRGDDMELIDGTPIDTDTADRIACDTSTVQHVVSDEGEPLKLGRRSREWNTAQRRAILVRDRGRCRFPGCDRTFVDIHHLVPWNHGGPTDVSNGICGCGRHHTLLHAGFTAAGDANGTVIFRRPDGTVIGTTSPR